MSVQNEMIAILDSGVGGLSIFKAIRKALPHLSIVYGCDNKNFPYGPKSPETVIQCISEFTKKTIQQFNPKLIVIACNTASTLALETLRKNSSLPIVGVVPAIKPAALKTKTKVIGLLATPGTVQRPYTNQLIQKYASDCKIIKVGSTRLVELSEEKLRGKILNLETVRNEIAPFFAPQTPLTVDTIILGCTHFPLLIDELSASTPKEIQWIDSSEAIANRVYSLTLPSQEVKPIFRAVFTQLNAEAQSLLPHLQSLGFSDALEIK